MISAIVLTKNEEKNIIQCLKTLEWCSEIIIIDDYSTDETLNKIRTLNNKKINIYKRNLSGNFSAQRNFGLDIAKYDWLLFIDADERVSDSLQYEILSKINNSLENIAGYYLTRKDRLWGKDINFGESNSFKLLRVARKGSGLWVGKVHEVWDIKGKTLVLKNTLIHLPHPKLEDFLYEINFYTNIRARELFSKGIKTNTLTIICFPILKFCQNYFFRLGILDGIRGLMSAIIMSFHSFLVRGKLWKLWEEKNA